MCNVKITSTDLTAIVSSLRTVRDHYPAGTIENSCISRAFEKLADLNAFDEYELIPMPIKTETPQIRKDFS